MIEDFYLYLISIPESRARSILKLKRVKSPFPPQETLHLWSDTHKALMGSLLLGWNHVLEDISFEEDWRVSVLPIPFEEAILYFRAKIPITKKEYYELDGKLRHRAFTVARLTELDAKNRIKEKLLDVLKTGKTIMQFWEESGKDELLKTTGFHSSSPWYWETVFRTNIQSSYNAGRRFGMEKNKSIKYYEFIGINDIRQTEICKTRNGIIRPAGDKFWDTNWPPLHFNCRSTVRPIYMEETDRRKIEITNKEDIKDIPKADKGFGLDPVSTGSFWKIPSSMLKRARQYGIIKELIELAKECGIKDFTLSNIENS